MGVAVPERLAELYVFFAFYDPVGVEVDLEANELISQMRGHLRGFYAIYNGQSYNGKILFAAFLRTAF